MLRERDLRARFIFEPRDLWIGVYWRFARECDYPDEHTRRCLSLLTVYICVLPMVPLKVELAWVTE